MLTSTGLKLLPLIGGEEVKKRGGEENLIGFETFRLTGALTLLVFFGEKNRPIDSKARGRICSS